MIKITLPQYINCKNKKTSLPKIDCEYWNADETECNQYCSIKKENTNYTKCSKCDIRKSLNPVQELKNILPQKNFYTIDKNGIKINEEFIENKQNKSFTSKAMSYTKVEGSQLIQGKVSQEVFDKRIKLCISCPQRINPSPNTEEIGWCKACGCSSRNPRAALSNKLWMPNWECPQKKFGKEEGQGFSIGDATNSLKGIVTSVTSLFKGNGNT